MKQLGRYRLDRIHGSGAFATVWQGFDTELEIPVAVKVLAENWSHHADVRERFLAEARLLRRIRDARVVRVHDIGVHEGQPFFVMDFIAGGTLADRADGSLPPARALDFAVQAARAVQVLHQAGVIHRDVKPSNLLVDITDDGAEHVLVADLGSSKRLAEASGITATTGTPSYMAPEQALGRAIDERCDVYALGVLTYVLISGKLPFDVSDPISLVTRSSADRPSRLGSDQALVAPVDGASLNALLVRSLALDPELRPRRAGEFADALEHVAEGGHHRSAGWPAWVVLPAAALVFAACALVTWFILH
ncbi:hypothetical protein BH09ACT10_BH09ACT10_26820 [soil metagenome]